MRQTLFYIPHQIFGVDLFGFGWLLAFWLLFSVGLMVWLVRRQGWKGDTFGYLPFLVIVGLAIVFVLPRLEVKAPSGETLGLPIRGYGSFVLAGFGSGVWLALVRARARGISEETIFSLAFWLFVSGVLGGRLFFVIEYWPEFRRPSWGETLVAIFRFTEGGLVVYGALLAGLIGIVLFCRRHKLSALELGDIVAPSLALGAALGRVGCLMNGCCYGGLCDSFPVGIEFPRYNAQVQRSVSPPYQHQLTTGRLHGFLLGEDSETGVPVVREIHGTAAAQSGLQVSDRIAAINGVRTRDMMAAQKVLKDSGPVIALTTERGWIARWTVESLPRRSLRVHPVQLYSAIDAFLICLLLILGEPYLTRRGAVLALLLTLYPLVRIVEEIIRVDEPPQFGTGLSISQLISLATWLIAGILWVVIYRGGDAKSEGKLAAAGRNG